MTAKFEDILAQIDTGPWTWIIFCLCSVWGLFGAMQAVSAVFLSPPTLHWCHLDQLQYLNWTLDQVKNASIPWDAAKSQYSSCEAFDRNYSAFDGLSFEDVLPTLDSSAPVVPCRSWDYDTSVFRSTVISEWDLVCDREYLRSLVQSVFMVGVFVGSPFNGYIADRFGRKRVLSVALFLFQGVAVLGALVLWFPAFLLCRFLMAISGHCVYQTSYIIAVETCSIRHRSTIGILFSVPFALGYILLPGVAYLVREWRLLHLAISLPTLLLVANTVLLPESPRWLVQKGRGAAAAEELQRAARWNRQPPLDATWLAATIAEIQAGSHRVSSSSKGTTPLNEGVSSTPGLCASCRALFSGPLLRTTVVLSAVWLSCTLVYYGISMNSANLSADPFLYTVFGGLVELPSYIFGAPVVRRLGRRLTLVISLLTTGVAILGPLAVTNADKSSWWFLSIVMVGKMMVTAAFQVLYLYTSELYPTCVRTQGLGVTSMIGRCGAIISPFITDNLGAVYWAAPSLVFGLSSAVAGCLTGLLPETVSQALPDTLQEMKAWQDTDGNHSGPGRSAERGPLLVNGDQVHLPVVLSSSGEAEALRRQITRHGEGSPDVTTTNGV